MTKFILITAASVLLAAGANAQQPIQSDSRLVLVDGVATNRKGFVDDLAQKDFKVWEDGKEQTISTFSFQPAGQKGKLVLFFDDSTIPAENQRNARAAAQKFIESAAGAGLLISIVEFDSGLRVTQDFTDNADLLKKAVGEAKLAAAPAAASARTNYSSRAVLVALRELAGGLVRVPGRKALVLLSGGIDAPSLDLNTTVVACNRSDIAVYSLDLGKGRQAGGSDLGDLNSGMDASGAGGTSSRISVRPPRGGQADTNESGVDVLPALAGSTGGFLIAHNNDISAGLITVGKEQSESYILGYIPLKEPQPGSCHTLKVKVDRGGLTTRFRPGYCEAKTPDIVTGTPAQRDLEARLNTNAPLPMRAAMMAPFFYISPNTARVDVAVDIPGQALAFTRDKGDKGKLQATLNVIAVASLPDGAVGARFNDSVNITLDDKKQVDEFAAKPYHYRKQFEAPSGKFNLQLAFSSGGTSGKIGMPLTIEEWKPSQFFLSGLALSNSARPAARQLPGDGDKVPLIVNGMELTPAADNRFHKSDKVFIYGELYEPAAAAGLSAHMVLLDGKTGEVVKDLGVTPLKSQTLPGKAAIPMGLILPVADLAPGSYTAKITALDAPGNQVTRGIYFELEP